MKTRSQENINRCYAEDTLHLDKLHKFFTAQFYSNLRRQKQMNQTKQSTDTTLLCTTLGNWGTAYFKRTIEISTATETFSIFYDT